jgi:glutathione S-transferase
VLKELETRGMENRGDGPYWLGSQPTLVDFQYLPFFERMPVYEALCDFVWPAECMQLKDWFAAMCELDSVSATLRPVDAHIEQQQRLNERIAAARRGAA